VRIIAAEFVQALHARIIWALLVKGETFDVRRLAPATEGAAA
jgi:hypothetical protein